MRCHGMGSGLEAGRESFARCARPRGAVARLVLVTAWAAASAGCGAIGAAPLERPDVLSFSVDTLDAVGVRLLRISGLAAHSALAVKRIDTVTEAGVVRVRVLMAPPEKGGSGTFSVVVHVPATVHRVEFGDAHEVIWSDAGDAR